MSARLPGLLSLAVLSAVAKAAAAGPALELAVHPCVGVSTEQVRAPLEVELATLVHDRRLAGLPTRSRVAVTCADRGLTIAVSDPQTGRSSAEHLTLEDLPDEALPRLLALSISERFAPLWTGGPAATSRARAEPALPVAAPAASWRILPGLAVRSFPATGLGLAWGGAVAVERRRGDFHLGGDTSVAAANQDVSLGRARLLLADAALQAGAHARAGAWSFGLDLGLRVGLVRLSGQAGQKAAAQALTRALGGPLLAATASTEMSARTRLCVVLEGGVAVRNVVGTVGDAEEVTVGGPWLGVSLRLGLGQ